MTPAEHYAAAEQLIAEGEEVVGAIRNAAERREELREKDGPVDVLTVASIKGLTSKMDELGKKAMGVWAQAQVHASLAGVHDSVANPAKYINHHGDNWYLR